MRRAIGVLSVVLLITAVAAAWSPAGAQFGALKDKLKKVEKIGKKVGDTIDKSADAADKLPAKTGEKPAEKPAEKSDEKSDEQPAAAAKGGTATSEDMALYTKYDFVPGDKSIFFDDLAKEEMGEFPSRWGLNEGVFEVVKQGGRNWVLCTNTGSIYPKVPKGVMPPKYTIELDLYASVGGGNRGHWTRIEWVDERGNSIAAFGLREYEDTHLRIMDKDLAAKQLTTPLTRGVHTMRVMATRTSMKCYIDNERVANVPAVEGFKPVGFRVYLQMFGSSAVPGNPALFGTLRYAEGGKTLREQLDEAGRIVTHGILFDSGSDKIKAESYKTLADISGLLTDDVALRVSIEGHTDSDGAEAANLTLSQARAKAVKDYLVANYKIDAARLEAKGWGEGKPIDANATPEGKTNNRRVELVKL
jgi:OOP family OmpA-OmpF porin